MYNIIDGKLVSEKIKSQIREEVEMMKSNGEKVPHLAAVLVGNDGASLTYVNHKIKACEYVGFNSSLIRYDETVSESKLLEKINELNEDTEVDGYLVQLPLPKHISSQKVLLAVNPEKDVDGFHPENIGKMMQGLSTFIPATPLGIIKLIEHYKIETSGKHCVVLGRSNIVGLPVSVMLAQNSYPGNCTVTLCHSRTKNLEEITKSADILIAAIGKPEFVRAKMVKSGAVVIDVGTTRVEDKTAKRGYRLKGDVNFKEVAPLCSYITPVPGGVGPMTIAMLLNNTLLSIKQKKKTLLKEGT